MAQPPTPQRIREAIAYFEGKLGRSLTPEERAVLQADVYKRAKQTADAALLGIVALAWKRIEKAEADGLPISDTLSDVGQALRDAYVGNATKPATRLDLVAKTFVLGALAAGRANALRERTRLGNAADPGAYTHQRFDAVLDDATSEICAACDGTILPISDAWWASHGPPLHFGCRSILTPITRREAMAMGITKAPNVHADDGFGDPHGAYVPRVEDYPRALFDAFQAKR